MPVADFRSGTTNFKPRQQTVAGVSLTLKPAPIVGKLRLVK